MKKLSIALLLFIVGTFNAQAQTVVGFNDPKYFSREFKKQYGRNAKSYQLGSD